LLFQQLNNEICFQSLWFVYQKRVSRNERNELFSRINLPGHFNIQLQVYGKTETFACHFICFKSMVNWCRQLKNIPLERSPKNSNEYRTSVVGFSTTSSITISIGRTGTFIPANPAETRCFPWNEFRVCVYIIFRVYTLYCV